MSSTITSGGPQMGAPVTRASAAPLPVLPAGSPQLTQPPLAQDSASFSRTYTVRSGDSMSKIAHRLGIPLSELLAANPQVTQQGGRHRRRADGGLIYPGDVLRIPTGGTPISSVAQRARMAQYAMPKKMAPQRFRPAPATHLPPPERARATAAGGPVGADSTIVPLGPLNQVGSPVEQSAAPVSYLPPTNFSPTVAPSPQQQYSTYAPQAYVQPQQQYSTYAPQAYPQPQQQYAGYSAPATSSWTPPVSDASVGSYYNPYSGQVSSSWHPPMSDAGYVGRSSYYGTGYYNSSGGYNTAYNPQTAYNPAYNTGYSPYTPDFGAPAQQPATQGNSRWLYGLGGLALGIAIDNYRLHHQ